MDRDDYEILIGALIVIALVVLVFILAVLMHKERKEREELVGTEIVIRNDTLMIYDYNSWKETYTLENGAEIDVKLIIKE